jgi:hypothetical protein
MEPELPSPTNEEVSTALPPAIVTTTKGRLRRTAAIIGELKELKDNNGLNIDNYRKYMLWLILISFI